MGGCACACPAVREEGPPCGPCGEYPDGRNGESVELPAKIVDISQFNGEQLTGTELADGAFYFGARASAGGEPEGAGMKFWPDGSCYEGHFENGLLHGHGRLIQSDGSTYDGEWVRGHAHGKGTLYKADGSVYVGDWADDKQHGRGVDTLPDSSKYSGEFAQGEKHGHGRFDWADGASYEGQFEDSRMHGEGTFWFTDGRIYQGQWDQGRMHGEGVLADAEGRRWKGEFVENDCVGQGVCRWPDGREFDGMWEDWPEHTEKLAEVTSSPGDAVEQVESVDVSLADTTPGTRTWSASRSGMRRMESANVRMKRLGSSSPSPGKRESWGNYGFAIGATLSLNSNSSGEDSFVGYRNSMDSAMGNMGSYMNDAGSMEFMRSVTFNDTPDFVMGGR